jgi:hypothetical protein
MEDSTLSQFEALFKEDLALALRASEISLERRQIGIQACQLLAASAHSHGNDLTISKWRASFGSHKCGGGVGTVNAAKLAGVRLLTAVWDMDWVATDRTPGTLLNKAEMVRKAGLLGQASQEIKHLTSVDGVYDALDAMIVRESPLVKHVEYVIKHVEDMPSSLRDKLVAALS